MSDLQRARRRPTPTPRRSGQPNVLSNQATPNTLSTMGSSGRGMTPASATAAGAARPAATAPSSTRPLPNDPRLERPAARPRQLPSLSTLLFVAFLIYSLVRILSQ